MTGSTKTAGAALLLAAVHCLCYLTAWGAAFAWLEHDGAARVPSWLIASISFLGFPLLLLPETWLLSARVTGLDDTAIVVAIAAVNSLGWGVAFTLAGRAWMRKRGIRQNAS